MNAYEPLTQELIERVLAGKRRIELQGEPAVRLSVSACESRGVAWQNRTRRRKFPVFVSVEPEGQPARIIR